MIILSVSCLSSQLLFWCLFCVSYLFSTSILFLLLTWLDLTWQQVITKLSWEIEITAVGRWFQICITGTRSMAAVSGNSSCHCSKNNLSCVYLLPTDAKSCLDRLDSANAWHSSPENAGGRRDEWTEARWRSFSCWPGGSHNRSVRIFILSIILLLLFYSEPAHVMWNDRNSCNQLPLYNRCVKHIYLIHYSCFISSFLFIVFSKKMRWNDYYQKE